MVYIIWQSTLPCFTLRGVVARFQTLLKPDDVQTVFNYCFLSSFIRTSLASKLLVNLGFQSGAMFMCNTQYLAYSEVPQRQK